MTDIITIEERIQTHRDWVNQFGVESLIKQYAEYQDFMSNRGKGYRLMIAQLEDRLDLAQRLGRVMESQRNELRAQYTTGHCEHNRAPGGCQLHNLHCGYPECDRKKV